MAVVRQSLADAINEATVEFRPEVHQWRENFRFQIRPVPPPKFVPLGGQGTITFLSMFCVGFRRNIEMFPSNIPQ